MFEPVFLGQVRLIPRPPTSLPPIPKTFPPAPPRPSIDTDSTMDVWSVCQQNPTAPQCRIPTRPITPPPPLLPPFTPIGFSPEGSQYYTYQYGGRPPVRGR